MAKKHRQGNPALVQPQSQQQAPTTFKVSAQTFAGPIPPPAVFAAYDQILAGAAERILAMAERNQVHRHAIEGEVVHGNVNAQTRGQWFAFVISCIVTGGGIYLIATGKDATGLSVIVTNLVGLGGLFIYSNESKKKELRAKGDMLTKPLSGP